MKYLVVKYTYSSFYGFNLVDKNERHAATKNVADVNSLTAMVAHEQPLLN
jgi:hypothetical protein